MIGNCLSNIIFFTIYADGKKRYNYSRETSSLGLTTFISMRAGVLTMLVTNPIWVIKTRTMLYHNAGQPETGWKLMTDTAKNMYRNEGPKAFFRGYPISLFLSLYGMISMTLYETSCKTLGYTESNKSEKSKILPFIAGGISKCGTSCLFYPVTVIKTRQQKQRYSTDEAIKMKTDKKIEKVNLEEAKKRPEIHHTTAL